MKFRSTAAVLGLVAASFAATTPTQQQLTLANLMVANVLPANNSYSNGTATVTWAGVAGATLTYNQSDCTTFVTALLKTGNVISGQQMVVWFGKSSPSLTLYYNAAVKNVGLTGFKQIANLQPGDLMISRYVDSTTVLGHMMIVDAAPVLVTTSATQKTYNVTVVDCTGDPHSGDTRVSPQTGVGRGTMRIYTDLSGNVVTWGWGTSSASTPYDPTQRPIIFAKVPAANRG